MTAGCACGSKLWAREDWVRERRLGASIVEGEGCAGPWRSEVRGGRRFPGKGRWWFAVHREK